MSAAYSPGCWGVPTHTKCTVASLASDASVVNDSLPEDKARELQAVEVRLE